MLRRFTRRRSKVLVLGLDCAAPELVFNEFYNELPVLASLMRGGTWGRLESSTPCITIPAWSSMLSSRDPGVLGFYGFRNRADYGYAPMQIANSSAVRVPRVWDILSAADKESVVIGVPQTYPVTPLNGHMISAFLTPGTGSAFTYPAVFKQEVLRVTPDYAFDVKPFRTDDKAGLQQRLFDVADIQFKLLKYAIKKKPWDFFMHVNMGVDRIHHAFWRYHDPSHRLYEPNNRYRDLIRDYYKQIDTQIGELIELADDDTTVIIASDHGVTRMDGGICINEWLWHEGWLALKTPPPEGKIIRFEDADIDWSRTRAWGAGGYYGRVFLNMAGREPQGVIPPDAYETTRDELAALIAAIPGPDREPLNTSVMKPQDVYTTVNNIAPDLMVYFGDLHWRSVGSLGHGRHYTFENDTGPDDANHATHGMFILHEPNRRGLGQIDDHQLMDIAPTILDRLRVSIPGVMQGRVIHVR